MEKRQLSKGEARATTTRTGLLDGSASTVP